MRALLLQFTYIRLGGHLLAGILTVFLLFPFLGRSGREKRLLRWSGSMLKITGVRVVARGRLPAVQDGGLLVVANHVSWLDIHVLHSLMPVRFISKAEVRSWPVIGWLADRAAGTLFLERTRKSDVRRMNERVASLLREGERLALFPEGTTSDGLDMLPFYPGLFQPVLDAGTTVWPVRIRYLDAQGRHALAAAYYGEMTMQESFRRIVAARRLVAEVEFLPVIEGGNLRRRDLAAQAEAVIRATWVGAAHGNPPGSDGHRPGEAR